METSVIVKQQSTSGNARNKCAHKSKKMRKYCESVGARRFVSPAAKVDYFQGLKDMVVYYAQKNKKSCAKCTN